MVYGGGGIYGIAYTLGVAHGLSAAGVPVEQAPALGTSAGSWTAAILATGHSYADVDALETPPLPTRRYGVLAGLARELLGDAGSPRVTVSAVCVAERRRHLLSGAQHALADLIAASSAVPALLPAHRVGGRLYVDGGLSSMTSLDAAPPARHTIVVAPLSGVVLGPIGRSQGVRLERDLRSWEHRHPGRRVTLVRPTRSIAAVVGAAPWALFDAARARAVYPLAFGQGLRAGQLLLVDRRGLTTAAAA